MAAKALVEKDLEDAKSQLTCWMVKMGHWRST